MASLSGAGLAAPPALAPELEFIFGEPERWESPAGPIASEGSHLRIELRKSGPFLLNRSLALKPVDIAAVEIEFANTDDAPEAFSPGNPRFFWARPRHAEMLGSWPFHNERSVELRQLEDHPHVWRGYLGLHGNWIGEIQQAYFGMPVPDAALSAESKPFVAVKRVSFLREVHPPIPAPPPAEERPKRFILLLLDTLRADHLQFMGYARETAPNLAQLAAESVQFHRAYSHGDGTVYSMPSILAGRYFSELYARPPQQGGIPAEFQTLAEAFKAGGYETHAWSTNPNVSRRTGYDQGFDTFQEIWPTGAAYARAEQLIRHLRATYTGLGTTPQFLYIHLMDPHNPYAPPEPFDRMWTDGYDGDQFVEGRMKGMGNEESMGIDAYWAESHNVGATDVRYAISQYDGAIRYMDSWLPTVLETVQYDPAFDTLIVTSDHGEQFYEHRFLAHNRSTLVEELHVPLLIRAPGIAPAIVQTRVGLIDLVPTICELFELAAPADLPGASLGPTLHGEAQAARPIIAEAAPVRGGVGVLLHDDALYALHLNINRYTHPWRVWPIEEQLFDLRDDPQCVANIAGLQPGRADAMNALLRELYPPIAAATREAIAGSEQTLTYGENLAAPIGDNGKPRVLAADGDRWTTQLAFEEPGKPHVLEITYTLEDARLQVACGYEGQKRPFYQYRFYKERSAPTAFRVVLRPEEHSGVLELKLQGAGAAAIESLSVRRVHAPELELAPWPGAPEAETSDTLTDEEAARLEALGYVL